jgi:tetratricopeptide (TPR) repeat protein
MSLKSYFQEQFEQLSDFMISLREVVRCVRIDPEMKPMLSKVLARMDDDQDFPHLFVSYAQSFRDAKTYFEGLAALISGEYVKNAQALREAGVQFAPPFEEASPPPAPFRFLRYAEALADKLPDHVGSLVFLLDPDDVSDRNGFQRSVRFLCEDTACPWLDSASALQPAERRQYLGLLAGFAFARKEYADAEELQRRWAEQARREGSPQELAAAFYNLGNTLTAKGDYDQAVEVYCQTCNLCLDHSMNSLAPLAYTNLGIALHRQGDFPRAFAALKVSRDMFKVQNVRPGEAYVVDCLAQMYADNGQTQEAELALCTLPVQRHQFRHVQGRSRRRNFGNHKQSWSVTTSKCARRTSLPR